MELEIADYFGLNAGNVEKGEALSDTERADDFILSDPSLKLLRGLSEKAAETRGEALSDHRARFEDRRRNYEMKLATRS